MYIIGSFPSSGRPSWTCFIDGNPVISEGHDGPGENNVILCSSLPSATASNLTVVASGTPDTPFLFDRIQYTPDASFSLDNATVVVSASDPQIQEDSGWTKFGPGLGIETSVQGSSLSFDFVGAFRL